MVNRTDKGFGTVVSLWRYPVKSMMGEELNAAEVTDRGFLGDRAYALVDQATGKIVSAKHPQKWARLFDCRAVFAEPPRAGEKTPPVRITLPDGSMVVSEQADLNQFFTNMLGRDVTWTTAASEALSLEEYWPDMEGLAHRDTVTEEAMPAGTFFDCAPFHILTTATIDRLRELYPHGRFETRRFRPNIVLHLDAGEKDFVEQAWHSRTLVIGDDVRLAITGPCSRCVMTTLPQGDLPKDPGILRTAVRHNQGHVGVYATVLRGGTIRRGDPLRLE